MKTQKKKFRETKAGQTIGRVLKGAFNIALDILPIPNVRNYFDKDQNGTVDTRDLAHFKWFEFAGAIALMSLLLYFKIINLETLITLIQTLLNP